MRTFNFTIISLILALIILIAPPLLLRVAQSPYLYTDASKVPNADAALILGASVVRGQPSRVLASRAQSAIRLYKDGKVQKILVTGDSSANYNEVLPVRLYLLAAGIPDKDVVLDRSGFDTYSSMYRARNVYMARSIIIVTQDFHLPRAVYLARIFGINAYGLAAKQNGTIFDYIREVPASWKAIWDVILNRVPKNIELPAPRVSGFALR